MNETFLNNMLMGITAYLVAAFGFGAFWTGRRREPPAGLRWALLTLILSGAWLATMGYAAMSGWVRPTGVMPPPILRLMALALIVTVLVALSPAAETLSEELPMS